MIYLDKEEDKNMQYVIIHDYVREAIEKEIRKAIGEYPYLVSEEENMRSDLISLYAETGKVGSITSKGKEIAP